MTAGTKRQACPSTRILLNDAHGGNTLTLGPALVLCSAATPARVATWSSPCSYGGAPWHCKPWPHTSHL